MAGRDVPFGAFNFRVDMEIPGGVAISAGFSEVSGLGTELTVAEYRNGDELTNYTRNVPGLHKGTDVTLKRGIISSADLWAWINLVHTSGVEGKIDTVTVTLNDEHHDAVQSWYLKGVLPLKYTGPTLNSKGGDDIAVEELSLKVDTISKISNNA